MLAEMTTEQTMKYMELDNERRRLDFQRQKAGFRLD